VVEPSSCPALFSQVYVMLPVSALRVEQSTVPEALPLTFALATSESAPLGDPQSSSVPQQELNLQRILLSSLFSEHTLLATHMQLNRT